MKIWYLVFLFSVVFLTLNGKLLRKYDCAYNSYNFDGELIPNHTLDLDVSPKNRWNHLLESKKIELLELFDVFEQFDNAYFDGRVLKLGVFNNFLPYPYNEELSGISEFTGITKGRIVMYNVFYELFTLCTSILALGENATNGTNQTTLFHVRNLDFGIFMGWDKLKHVWKISEALKPLTVSLDFQRSGKTVYKAVTFIGHIGVLTAMKPGKFSLTVNERFDANGGFIGIIMWLLGDRKTQWLSFLTRDVMEKAESFSEAKQILSKVPLIAPVYFVLGGIDRSQADIITRSRRRLKHDQGFNECCKDETLFNQYNDINNSTLNKTFLFDYQTSTKKKSDSNNWFLLQTNNDWNKKSYFDDRYERASECLRETQQKNLSIGFPSLYDVLSTRPVLNKLSIYTTLMNTREGLMETYLRNCYDPCPPW